MSSDPNPLPDDLASQPLPAEDLQPIAPLPAPPSTPAQYPPWSLWDVGAIALVAFACMSVFGLISGTIAVHVFKLPLQGIERNPRLVIPTEFLAYVVTLAFMVMVLRSRHLPFWETIGWRRTTRVPGYFVLGFLLSVGVGLATALLPIPKQLPIDKYFADTIGTWMLAIFGVTIAPLMEELFFRGFLYPALARHLGVGVSVVLTAAGFALLHSAQLAAAWAPLLLLFIVGIVLTTLRARTGSVVPGFFVHVAYNLTIFTELFFQTSHFHNFSNLGLIH